MTRGIATPLTKGPFASAIPDTSGFASVPSLGGSGGLSNDLMPWLIGVDMFMTPISEVGSSFAFVQTSSLYNGYRVLSNQNDEVNYDLVFAAGTWTFELIYVAYSSAGIATIQFNGTSVGTIDMYGAATSYNNRSRISGISVTSSGKVRVKILMATKNASSSGYAASLHHLQVKRTA